MQAIELPDGLLLQAHVLDALASLPAESVQMCVTSPPYFGLRSYSGEQRTIWGGEKACGHEWLVGNLPATKMAQQGSTETVKYAALVAQTKGAAGSTCQHCGAWYGAYGLEDTPARWASHTLEWLRAVRRVLRRDGVVWLNVGSAYAQNGSSMGGQEGHSEKGRYDHGGWTGRAARAGKTALGNYKPLDLINPFALLYPGLLADGWYVRSVVIWAKPNPMPESMSGTMWTEHMRIWCENCDERDSFKAGKCQRCGAGNESRKRVSCPKFLGGCPKCDPNEGLVLERGSWRPTSSYEYVIMLAKSASYYSDGEGVREPHTESSIERLKYPFAGGAKGGANGSNNNWTVGEFDGGKTHPIFSPAGRNLRDVWELPTQPYSGAHFATYPEELVKRCILASTPDAGVCAVCGAPWARVIEHRAIPQDGQTSTAYEISSKANRLALLRQAARERGSEYVSETTTLGWRPHLLTL